jgi:adenosylcobinamide-phosphate synthase
MIGAMTLVAPASMAVALMVDARFGEPPPARQPVVWIGRLLTFAGRRLPDLPPATAFLAGAMVWMLAGTLVASLAWAVERGVALLLEPAALWGRIAGEAVLYGVLLKRLLAWRMLREEVAAVESALTEGVDAGRVRIARIAGREPGRLTLIEVRETAIESLAENLNDSVVAPLVWFAIGGLPGAALYRFANTADAQWGTRGRWEWAGKWAARADDVLSWLPARLTGIALVPPALWPALVREAHQTASPNGGWPMGAMALRLGVHLGRPGFYVLNKSGRDVMPDDTARGIRLALRTISWLLVPLSGLAIAVRVAS